MRESFQCPGCSSTSFSDAWVVPAQPVVLNYRFASPEAAAAIPRRDMHLIECPLCGLIFNATLDESAIRYDENYDNRQGFSPAFVSHLEAVATHLATNYPLDHGVLLEVGCGKGDFLKLACRMTGSAGIGFDTSCEIEGPSDDNTRFLKRYADESDVPEKVNAIFCRHVVEHVSEIGSFFSLLYRMAVAGKADVVYVETPVWDWIVSHGAFWDVFHEHCNYFPAATLAHLAVRAGFTVLDHIMVFGGQYQALCLAPDAGRVAPPPPIHVPPTLMDFATRFQSSIESLRTSIRQRNGGGEWVIWGAGAKGVSLANHLEGFAPAFVVDVNPGKWGMFIPGTSIPVVPPVADHLRKASLILVANPNYLSEIRTAVAEMGLAPTLLPA